MDRTQVRSNERERQSEAQVVKSKGTMTEK